MTVASFHLVREQGLRAPLALARLAADRPRLHRVDGLRFFRVLGTGRGSSTSVSMDVRRTALFAVWDDEASLDAFLAGPLGRLRWDHAAEAWSVRLRSLGGHGRWRGFDPLAGLDAGRDGAVVAIVTRADVHVRRWAPFLRAGRPVSQAVQAAPGLVAVVGIGEAPLGRQATFSLWRSLADARAFAHDDPVHHEVVRRTRSQRWYGEELFARFEPYASEGTWDGRDPLGGPVRGRG